jgi:hypothetical protein
MCFNVMKLVFNSRSVELSKQIGMVDRESTGILSALGVHSRSIFVGNKLG